MTDSDKNKRIYECLKELYILTHIVDGLGERSEPSPEFDPLGINTLGEFEANPALFNPRGPEEVHLP